MDVSGATAAEPTSKMYWGPRLWRLFHLLAEISDRRDMYMLWNPLLHLTAAVIPCERCRRHLGAYMKTHSFVRFRSTIPVTGRAVREKARVELFALHNAVNERLKKSAWAPADLAAYRMPRTEARATIIQIYDEIKAAWTPLVHMGITAAFFTEWKATLNRMLALSAGGPDP
jgi:hypothetical protein